MATQVLKRHPIRGFLYGIFFGLGLALVAIGQGWAALGTWSSFLVFVVGVVVATLWGTFGPSKKPKGPPPAEPDAVEPPTPSRFDDFDKPRDEEPAADAVAPDAAPDEAGGEIAVEDAPPDDATDDSDDR